MKYYCYNQEGLYATLHELAEHDPPLSIDCKPIKNNEWAKKHRQFEAMINTIATHKNQNREDVKKDVKIEWGKVEIRYNALNGKKAYKIPSIMTYSLEELKQIIGELDVWMSENGIVDETKSLQSVQG